MTGAWPHESLKDFYAGLTATIPDEHCMLANGRRVVLSGLAFARPAVALSHEEWLRSVELRIAEALTWPA